MRVIVLWPWANNGALVVVVILVPEIPVETPIYFDRKSSFGSLVSHGVRRNHDSWIAIRICYSTALSIIVINPIRSEQSNSGHYLNCGIDEEETIPHEVKATTQWMTDAVEEVINYSVAVDPIVVIASVEVESGIRCPIYRRGKHPRLDAYTKVRDRYSGNLRWISIVSNNRRDIERELLRW